MNHIGQELLVREYTKDQFGNPRDLVFQLNQVEHDTYTRKNADLLVSIKISLQDALMGFTLPIKGLDNKDIWIKCKRGDIKEIEDVLILAGQGIYMCIHICIILCTYACTVRLLNLVIVSTS